MKDYLVRAMTTNKEIRVLAVNSTEVVKQAQQAHQTTPVATAALGRSLTAGLLMGSLVKSGSEISLSIVGDGPLKRVVVHANYKGEVRGYVGNSQIDLLTTEAGKLDVATAIGNGELIVKKNLGLKEPYQGSVPLISGEIGDDLTYYFTKSEQIPSSVGLGVLVDSDCSVKAAGGFIIQLLPEASEETINQLEENIANINSVSKLIAKGLSPEELLKKLLKGFKYRILAETDVQFKCKCNYKDIKNLAISLGEEELKSIIEEEDEVEIKCHFCGEKYKFSAIEVEEMLSESKS